MNAGKHTPGPWNVFDETKISGSRVLMPGGKAHAFTLAETAGYKGEREANARLIAAAPSMLEALEKIAAGPFRGYPQGSELAKWVRAVAGEAIAAARGEVSA